MSTRHADDDIVVCAICGVQADGQQYFMVRASWIRAGGFGSIPDEAIVHVRCDDRERARLTANAHATQATKLTTPREKLTQ